MRFAITCDFPRQTNVEFVRIVDHGEIEIRIFERGVGPTTSSGTGTCATSAASMTLRGVDRKLSVRAPGGTQRVEWADAAARDFADGTGRADCAGRGLVDGRECKTAGRVGGEHDCCYFPG